MARVNMVASASEDPALLYCVKTVKLVITAAANRFSTVVRHDRQ